MIQNRIRKKQLDYTWPGFVDALSSLLMVIIFVLMIFVISQFFISKKMSGQDEALINLKNNLTELSELLSLERDTTSELATQLSVLEEKILVIKEDLIKERAIAKQYQEELRGAKNINAVNEDEINKLKITLDEKIENTTRLRNEVSDLGNQMNKRNFEIQSKDQILKANKEEINQLISTTLNLKNKLTQLQTLLSAYKAKDEKENVKTLNLGKDVNSALARRVEELEKFKSDFFGRVRELIKGRKEIRVVGDRFVFQSEVLFSLGSDELGREGQLEMQKLAATLMEIEESLPTDIDWILQIEGHTDSLPVKAGQTYRDNWELSTKRSLSVLRYLIKQGIEPSRLSASGYGSFQPIDVNNTKSARMKNRRIEMKITQNTKIK